MRLAILGSTRGTNMMAIQQAIDAKQLPATISVVVSNKRDAYILERAAQYQLPAVFIDPHGLSREAFDEEVSQLLLQHEIDLIVLVGYMRILSAPFVQQWERRIINVHPSLLPAFAGLMDLEVHRAVLASGVSKTGCTVHYVTEEVDAGPIVWQETCDVLPGDTPDTLKARVQALEGTALIKAISMV